MAFSELRVAVAVDCCDEGDDKDSDDADVEDDNVNDRLLASPSY